MACMAAGLVKGEGFAVDASVMEANASRSNAGVLRSEAKTACCRHGLWNGQIPWLAGEGEEDHPAHSGLGEERST